MNAKTKELLINKVKEFNNANHVSLDPDKFITFGDQLLEEGTDIAALYQDFYKEVLKECYRSLVEETNNEPDFYTDEKGSRIDIRIKSLDIAENTKKMISGLDNFMATNAMVIFSEKPEKKEELPAEVMMNGGLKADAYKDALEDVYRLSTEEAEYAKLGKNRAQSVVEARNILRDMPVLNNASVFFQKVYTHPTKDTTEQDILAAREKRDEALDQVSRKMVRFSVIYKNLRAEHRSHWFGWRWFTTEGKESRRILQSLKAGFCREFNIRENRATNFMLEHAKDISAQKFCSQTALRHLNDVHYFEKAEGRMNDPQFQADFMKHITNIEEKASEEKMSLADDDLNLENEKGELYENELKQDFKEDELVQIDTETQENDAYRAAHSSNKPAAEKRKELQAMNEAFDAAEQEARPFKDVDLDDSYDIPKQEETEGFVTDEDVAEVNDGLVK